MSRCCIDCDPFKCFRRKQRPTADEQAANASDDNSDKDSGQQPPQLPQLPPIDLGHIHLPGEHPPTPDPMHDIIFAPTIPPGGPPPLPDRDYFVNGFACSAPGTIATQVGIRPKLGSAQGKDDVNAGQEPPFGNLQARMEPQPRGYCDILAEAMEAMSQETNEEYALEKKLNPGKGSSGVQDIGGLFPEVAAEVRNIVSQIVVPEPEMTEYDDGSQVAFSVDIKPPPRPLGLNWKPAQVVDRVCRGLDRMMEIRAGIHRILRERPEYAVGLPYTIQQKKDLEMKCLTTLSHFTNYMTEETPFQHDKEPIRLLVTCFEIIVQCASASLAATRKAAENSKSQEEDDAIGRQFQRWVVQTWSDIWVLEDETSSYLKIPPAVKRPRGTA